MIKIICYISDCAIKHKSLEMIESLYLKTNANNQKNNITGILIYKDNNFFQIIEGDQTIIDTTYDIIKTDPRHKNIFNVINTTITERMFEDYNFGFTIIDTENGLHQLQEYLDWLKVAENKLANKVIAIVENFIYH